MSFEIESGQTVAIIGKTGSGKSTIAKILTRLIDYKDGSVKISGNELKDFKKNILEAKLDLYYKNLFFLREVFMIILELRIARHQKRIFEGLPKLLQLKKIFLVLKMVMKQW